MRTHKVGTLTLGCMLILFGVLFLVHLFTGFMSFQFIFRLWPVVFLLLGVEVLLSAIPTKRFQFTFSAGSVVLLIIMMIFAMMMAGSEQFIEALDHYPWLYPEAIKRRADGPLIQAVRASLLPGSSQFRDNCSISSSVRRICLRLSALCSALCCLRQRLVPRSGWVRTTWAYRKPSWS